MTRRRPEDNWTSIQTLSQSSERISLQHTIFNTSSTVVVGLTLPYLLSWFKIFYLFLFYKEKMLKIKGLLGILLVMSCLIAISLCDDDDRSLLGCFTGMNRCSEWSSWFSNRLLDSCNDHCIKGGILYLLFLCILLDIKIGHYRTYSGSIGGTCVRIPSNCRLRSEGATVLQCRCY